MSDVGDIIILGYCYSFFAFLLTDRIYSNLICLFTLMFHGALIVKNFQYIQGNTLIPSKPNEEPMIYLFYHQAKGW